MRPDGHHYGGHVCEMHERLAGGLLDVDVQDLAAVRKLGSENVGIDVPAHAGHAQVTGGTRVKLVQLTVRWSIEAPSKEREKPHESHVVTTHY